MRLLWTLLIFSLFVSAAANANSIPIFNITSVDIGFYPGDNDIGGMFFSFSGPGISITGDGFFNCSGWCNSLSYFPAGYPIDFTSLTTTDYFAQIRGKTYSGFNAFSSPWTLTFGNFTVPGGEVPAVLNNGLILGHVGSGNSLSAFYLKVPPGTLLVQFFQSDVDPSLYTFLGGGEFVASRTVVPEPATMALTATGLAAIVGLVRRKYARYSA
jgi:hypothetical protein